MIDHIMKHFNAKKQKLQFAGMDYVFLHWQEKMAFLTLIVAMDELHKEGRNSYSMTRLLKTAHQLRKTDFTTENRLRRLAWVMVGTKPKYLHIRQKGNYRIVSPSDYVKKHLLTPIERIEP